MEFEQNNPAQHAETDARLALLHNFSKTHSLINSRNRCGKLLHHCVLWTASARRAFLVGLDGGINFL